MCLICRSLHDALCVLTQTVKETRTVPGGGCMEVAMAEAIDAEVPLTAGNCHYNAYDLHTKFIWQLVPLIAGDYHRHVYSIRTTIFYRHNPHHL